MLLADLDRRAHALTAFRAVGEDGRQYTAVTFPKDPWGGCERSIRMFRKVGWLEPTTAESYAVLDVLDEAGDIVQDFGIRDARAFQQIKRRLDLRVEDDDR